jgi:hypothetical protein
MKDYMSDLSGKRAVLLIYLGIVLIKVLLSFQIPSPFIFSDEVVYEKMAQSFFDSGRFLIYGLPSEIYPPLYPIAISGTYLLGDITIVYPAMKIINILLASLIVFPVWLIAREFLDKEKSLFVVILTALLPGGFIMPFTLVSENLFYPMFMLSIYLIIRSTGGDNARWDILCGFVIGLTVLTRMIGFVLVIGLIMALLIRGARKNIFSSFTVIINKWRIFLSLGLTLLPWILRNVYYFGLKGFLGGPGGYDVGEIVTPEKSLLSIISWSFMHVGYFVFATAIIFFIFSMVLTKDFFKKRSTEENQGVATLIIVSWTTLSFLILLSAQTRVAWGSGGSFALMGRYLDPILPAFLIMGVVGFECGKKKSFWFASAISIIALLGIPLDSRIRSFNSPDTYMLAAPAYLNETGIIPFRINEFEVKLILSLFVLIISILLWKNVLKWKEFKYSVILFFIVSSTAAFGVAYSASHDVSEQMVIPHWLHDNTPAGSTVLFDQRDNNETFWPQFGVMFWTDDYVEIGNVNNSADYIVSLHKLDRPLLLEVRASTKVMRPSDNVYYLYLANYSREP